ncbi:hypothetical protein [Sphingopyxis terrae]|uniref:hypothetical protein n=1 Tax=Sphingopyxis terrae TaxID=33052 RepID=UPI00362677A7
MDSREDAKTRRSFLGPKGPLLRQAARLASTPERASRFAASATSSRLRVFA